ncbi:MAG: RsmD family RNA methyltransferase [Lentisphaeria bacterium]|nr:RsmD family RNA methyltransferase [Lentisphaeria bacterium]
MSFYATFISGFDSLVAKLLPRDGMNVVRMLDGAVEFESVTPPPDIPYLNNIFVVLRSLSHTNLNRLAQDVIANPPPFCSLPPKNFRVFVSQENELVSLPGNLMHDLVDAFARISRSPFSPRQAEAEFWLLSRSEGLSYCLYRLTSVKKHCARGELRPELATLLCECSNPQSDDVFLDPFAGSGSIPFARSRLKQSFHGIFASEIQSELADNIKKTIRKIHNAKMQRSFFVRCQDFLSNTFQSSTFTVIVTDPPWGIYEPITTDFYPALLREADRLLKPNGRFVLLTAAPNATHSLPQSLQPITEYHILVSGQKATVYSFTKTIIL